MNEDNIEGLDAMLRAIDEIQLTRDEKAQIVTAGAKVVEEQLRQDTKKMENKQLPNIIMDFKKSHGGRYEYKGHLYDGVIFKPNEFLDGSTNVGFRKGYVTVAHWLNTGTYKQPATFFLNHSFDAIKSNTAVDDAQALKTQEIFTKKGF